MNKKTLVFDVDDTISIHKNRDYEHAVPIQPVIDKLNRLHDEGYYIKLFTGRGQISCNGDLDLILKTKKPVLEKWLEEHNVKYDELIFGKPLGDWYIDDKGLSVSDFLNAEFRQLKGGSNESIYREFNKVIKISKTSQMQNEWYHEAESLGFNVPKIYSCVTDTLYMEYIDGDQLCDCCTKQDISELISICKSFKAIKKNTYFNINAYCENLKKHLDTEIVDNVCTLIRQNSDEIEQRLSFCHGDLTLGNIIKRNNVLILIDPNYKKDLTSYILDLAKIRQSLEDYEYMFDLSTKKNSWLRDYFDSLIDEKDLFLVKLFEISHWIRLYDYKPEDERYKAEAMIKKLYEEI